MKWGLCLAGGGVKGMAHIGAIKALEEANIKFHCVSGTSSGSIVATLYACGYTTDEMYQIFIKHAKQIKYVDLKNIKKFIVHLSNGVLKIDGLNSGEIIYQLIHQYCGKKGITNIHQVKMPLLIPSVNLCDEKLYIFYSQKNENFKCPKNIKYITDIDIATAVQASCSYPGIFSPCDKYQDTLLIDGGIEENVPWREMKRVGVDKVLSIVFSDEITQKCCHSMIGIVHKSFEILCHELAKYEWDGTDYLLEVKHKNIGLLNTKNMKELYQEGYKQMKQYIIDNQLNDKILI